MMQVAKKKMEVSRNMLAGIGDAALILRMRTKEPSEIQNSPKALPIGFNE
jgi:hypothetical protein